MYHAFVVAVGIYGDAGNFHDYEAVLLDVIGHLAFQTGNAAVDEGSLYSSGRQWSEAECFELVRVCSADITYADYCLEHGCWRNADDTFAGIHKGAERVIPFSCGYDNVLRKVYRHGP